MGNLVSSSLIQPQLSSRKNIYHSPKALQYDSKNIQPCAAMARPDPDPDEPSHAHRFPANLDRAVLDAEEKHMIVDIIKEVSSRMSPRWRPALIRLRTGAAAEALTQRTPRYPLTESHSRSAMLKIEPSSIKTRRPVSHRQQGEAMKRLQPMSPFQSVSLARV